MDEVSPRRPGVPPWSTKKKEASRPRDGSATPFRRTGLRLHHRRKRVEPALEKRPSDYCLISRRNVSGTKSNPTTNDIAAIAIG